MPSIEVVYIAKQTSNSLITTNNYHIVNLFHAFFLFQGKLTLNCLLSNFPLMVAISGVNNNI
jgi:hypothetical protein